MEEEREGLKVDKKVSIAFIGAIFVQTFLVGWWAATAAGELATLKDKVEAQTSNRFTRIEAKIIIESTDRRMDTNENLVLEHSIRIRELELIARDLIAYNRGRDRI